jgi:hypothetical protein
MTDQSRAPGYDPLNDPSIRPERRRFRIPGLERIRESRWPGRAVLALVAVVVLYYPVGMIVSHKVDDDPLFLVQAEGGRSSAIATSAALIRREVEQNGWKANNPWFFPSAPLDNMPNFQQGIIGSLSRFAIEMADHIGRVRGSSQVDADLENAAGLLKYRGDVWVFNFSTSLMPTATSEAQYRAAAAALERYNERLGAGQAVFERRADNLQITLDRISADLGSLSAALDSANDEFGAFSRTTDDVFYQTKGRLYGYWKILQGLEQDYRNVIAERELQAVWAQMQESLKDGSMMDPLVILNGSSDSILIPSHLAAQGFYLLRARTRLREISDVLQK